MLNLILMNVTAGVNDVGRAIYVMSKHPDETASFLSFIVFLFISGIICAIIAGVATVVIKSSLSLSKEDSQKCFVGIGGGLLALSVIGYLIA